ncbi:MAG TPA: hypothetical protein VF126_11265, partial [Acidobacteriaceae bacterium]
MERTIAADFVRRLHSLSGRILPPSPEPTDDSGKDYMLYHAVSAVTPYLAGFPGVTIRPALIDPIDWVDDWPVVRGGYGPSDTPQPAPAAQPWQYNSYQTRIRPDDLPGARIASLSDEF